MSPDLIFRKQREARGLSGLITLALWTALSGYAESASTRYALDAAGTRPEPTVAIENVCAWPNLTLLRDGTVIATIFNQPSHLKMPGDVDCWGSEDGGRTWAKRGTPAPRDNPTVARGNVAAGVAANGDLIVISSGWSDPAAKNGRGVALSPLVSRSSDGGRTWTMNTNAFLCGWPESACTQVSPEGYLVPFGDVLPGGDGLLRVALYGMVKGTTRVYLSRDDGKTWGEPALISKDAVIHEPALFHLGASKWLCAARLDGLDLYTSDDDARTWVKSNAALTGRAKHPGHFTRLRDKRILLSYGNRLGPIGVDALFSADEGVTWIGPFRVADLQGDMGYPSSIQLSDGQILTAYYSALLKGNKRYHMGTVIWDPGSLTNSVQEPGR